MSNYSSRTKSLGELVDSLIVNSNNLTLLIVLKMLYGGLIRGLPDTCKKSEVRPQHFQNYWFSLQYFATLVFAADAEVRTLWGLASAEKLCGHSTEQRSFSQK